MRVWSFYDKATGLFDGSTYGCGHGEFVEANARGRGSIEGRFDPLSQRVDVDVEAGTVVDYQPPAPDADHEWDPTAKRWRLKLGVAAAREARATALALIDALERQQHRALREATLGKPGAKERLQSIDDQIAQLRVHL